ncbi:IS66-like element accessory protein TnpA [Paraburkholderia xenovorans]
MLVSTSTFKWTLPMAENRNLKERLVTGFERDGRRRCFDEQAKRELVLACLRPGVSVAGMALEYGLNANLLRKWIRQYQSEAGSHVAPNGVAKAMPAFIPVVQPEHAEVTTCEAHVAPVTLARQAQCVTQPSRLIAELPNGVTLRLECAGDNASLVMTMIETLGRCHVPVRR